MCISSSAFYLHLLGHWVTDLGFGHFRMNSLKLGLSQMTRQLIQLLFVCPVFQECLLCFPLQFLGLSVAVGWLLVFKHLLRHWMTAPGCVHFRVNSLKLGLSHMTRRLIQSVFVCPLFQECLLYFPFQFLGLSVIVCWILAFIHLVGHWMTDPGFFHFWMNSLKLGLSQITRRLIQLACLLYFPHVSHSLCYDLANLCIWNQYL